MDARPNDQIERTNGASNGPGWHARLKPKLSPINERRWRNFRANRRGYWSLWLFLILLVGALGAELIANDRPIIARYKGETLLPFLVDYPEAKFGGFLAITDYKDPFILDEIEKNGWMLWPPIRHSYSSINKDYPRIKGAEGRCLGFPAPPPWATNAALSETTPEQLARFQALGNRNWLGTDDQGRDVVARVIYGFRLSIVFALLLTVIGSTIGIAAGAIQGYFGGLVDLVFQRVLEVWSSVPRLYVLLIISAVLVPGFWTLLGILLLFEWVSLVGLVRAEFLRGRTFDYVRAARARGLSNATNMFKHLSPNAMVATLTFIPFELSGAITALTALDFLGLGMPPGSPSLGELLLQGKSNLQAPWLGLTAFFSLAIVLSLLIFIGEAVRDALDPRKTFG